MLFHPSLLHIITCQDELLRKLELAWTSHSRPDTSEAPDFAQYFEDFLPHLVLYTDYIGNYKKAAALHSSFCRWQLLTRWQRAITACCDALVPSSQRMCRSGAVYGV